jgi:hypothetical protein
MVNPTVNSLVLKHCRINPSALERAAAALGRLHRLRSLQVTQSDTLMRLAAQLTGLLSLQVDQSAAATRLAIGLKSLEGNRATPSLDEQLMLLATRNTQLQKLVITGPPLIYKDLSAGHFKDLLLSCPGLTGLELHHRSIDQDGLDALLTHGTNITHLHLSSSSLTASRAHAPCSWKVLSLATPSLQLLAYLPLKSLQELTLTVAGYSWPSIGDTLMLYLHPATPAPQLLSLVSQAASNIAACPACVKQPHQRFTGLHLACMRPSLMPQERVQLFEALAPLRVLQLEQLTIWTPLELGSPEVEALVHSLGGSIESLTLWGCTLQSSFWRPLAQHLRKVQYLTLDRGVATNVSDLGSFLEICSQSRPGNLLNIILGRGVLPATSAADLQAQIVAGQLQDIRLVCI